MYYQKEAEKQRLTEEKIVSLERRVKELGMSSISTNYQLICSES